MDTLWKIMGIFGPIAITALSVILVLQNRSKPVGPAAEQAERKRLEALLSSTLFGIITEIERNYGDKTGAFKFSAALERVLALVPDKWKGLLDADYLGGLIEKGLAAAKEKWEKNPAFLAGAAGE